MVDLCAIADICARMDAHEGQAAWAQGIFSVGAIIAAIAIERGSARRQQKQFEHAGLMRKRQGVETVMAVGALAAYAMTWTLRSCEDMRRPADGIPHSRVYEKWASLMADWQAALRMLMERVADPVLVVDLVGFIHAMTPASEGRNQLQVIEEADHSMRSSWTRLQKTVQAIADAADVPMNLPAFDSDRPMGADAHASSSMSQ